MSNVICSIIMPTFNTKEEYLRDAIESILAQTEKNFEFIIIDDGSTGNDSEIVSSYNDKRIRLYKNDKNKGISFTLNRAISLSKGRYIMRMDSDDISLGNRLETMISFMEKNSNIDIAGSGKINFGVNNKKYLMPRTNDEIRSTLLFQSPFVHPSVVFRKSSIDKFQIKYKDEEKAEDYNLWFECAKNNELIFANVEKYLLRYRVHNSQITKKDDKIFRSTQSIIKKTFNYLDIDLTDLELDLYTKFSTASDPLLVEELIIIDEIINKMILSLDNDTRFNVDVLKNIFGEKYTKECIRQLITYKNYNGIAYYRSKIAEFYNPSVLYKIVLRYIYSVSKFKSI